MKHDDVMCTDMSAFGLNTGTNTPGYKAVKKAAIEITIEKMMGVSIPINSHHKKEPQKHSRK